MKNRSIQLLSLLLAGMLQVAPLLRSFLPNAQGLAPSAWGFVLKIGVGATALLGFDAVSQASSLALSPVNATVGTPYSGVISYSGHAGSVHSSSCNGNCLYAGASFVTNGLTISYPANGSKILISGTPTATNTINFVTVIYENTSCVSSSHTYTQTVKLLINPAGATAAPPSMTAAPGNLTAQVGTDVELSGGASGVPTPQYQWWRGLTPIAGATNSVLSITNVQLINSGTYTLTASNSQNVGGTILTLPSATCYLSPCISGGTNFSAYNYTNFAPASVALTMYSLITNVSTATNTYSWTYNGVNILSTSNTLPLTAAQLTPAKGGTYTVTFNSTNSGGAIVSGQNFDSYWAFGYPPRFTNSLPATTNLTAGNNVTLALPIGGSLNVYNSGLAGHGHGAGADYITNNTDPDVFWFKDGSLIAAQTYVCGPTTGATYSNSAVNATLTLTSVATANNGSYTVVATNFWGSTTSSAVALTVSGGVTPGPGFTVQPPIALARLQGQNGSISVTATGTPSLFYQWQKTGLGNLANGGVYSGVNTNVLTLTSVGLSDAGTYSVIVTNAGGASTSSVTALSVTLPPTLTADGSLPGILQFTGLTATGLAYTVQAATNLSTGPWIPVFSTTTGPAGTISFSTNATSNPSQFFRVAFP